MHVAAVSAVLLVLSFASIALGMFIAFSHSSLLQIIASTNILFGNIGLYLAVSKLIGLNFTIISLPVTVSVLSLPWAIYAIWPIAHPLLIQASRALKPGAQNPWQAIQQAPKVA